MYPKYIKEDISMAQRNDTNKNLVRAVLLGLAASVVTTPLADIASAQTLKEYKAQLAEQYPAYREVLEKEANSVVVSSGEKEVKITKDSDYSELTARGGGWLKLVAEPGAKLKPTVIASDVGNGKHGPEGGYVNLVVGDVDWSRPESIKSNPDNVAHMEDVIFGATAGDIVLTNGTVVAQAKNLYGGYARGFNGEIVIGEEEEKTVSANAVLKLAGNTKFNTTDINGGPTMSSHGFIVITDKGTLEAESAQIFYAGLGDGTVADPQEIRSDADQAIYFKAGTLLLDDPKYNKAYLETANTLVKQADYGATVVAVKEKTQQADPGTGGTTPDVKPSGNSVVAETDEWKHVVLDENSSYDRLQANGEGWLTVTAKDGTKVQPTKIVSATGSCVHGQEGGYVHVAVGDVNWDDPASIKSTPEKVADMTDVKFEVYDGDIVFANGTVKAKAENFFAGSEGYISIGEMDDTDSFEGLFNASAVLKLVGDTRFNTANWTDEDGNTFSRSNYLVLTERGTLEANSAQIFDRGLGMTGQVKDPKAIRSDADDAIDFRAGTLLLDDALYNDDYLEKANTLIKATDGGKTNVAVKDSASKAIVRDISEVPNDSYFAGVNIDKDSLVLGNDGDSKVDKLNATSINLNGDFSATVTIKDGKKLHLGSDLAGRDLITLNDETPRNATATINVQGGGSLILGTTDVNNTIAGTVNLTDDGSELNIERGWQDIDKIVAETGTKVNIGKGTVLTTNEGDGTIELKAGATVQVNGMLTKTNIIGEADARIVVGDKDSSGRMFVGALSSFQGSIFLDPVWKDGTTISDASQFALKNASNVGFGLTVGRNSLASLGTADTFEAINAFNASGLKWGENDTTAALYLSKPVTVAATGGIRVDGSAVDAASSAAALDTAEFADNSLLMVNAENLNGGVALTGNVLKVADSAKLYLDNISDGRVYTIADFNDTDDAKGWYTDSKNIITNKLFGTVVNGNQVTASRKKLADVLPGAVLPNIVDNMTFSQQDREDNPAVRYIAMATGGLHTDAQSTELINVAAQPAEVVGATATALANSTDFADQAQSHLSFLNESDVVDDQAWVKYGHRKGTLNGLGLGGMDADYDTSYNSVTVGYDLASIDDFHHGIAVSYGKGSSDAALEHNDFNTKGISWYGSFKHGDNNMMMDIGYYHTQHDVTGLLQAKPDTDVFTMGITNEFRFPLGKANEDGSVTGNNAIIPHVGVRYSHIGTPSYTGYYDGGEAFRYNPSGKNIFTLPLGVGFVSENRSADLVTRFYADVAYVPVIGGRSADMHVQAAGINAADVFSYDASYGSSFVGSIGVKQESDSFEWGLSYRYSGNSDWHNNDIMANVAWKF